MKTPLQIANEKRNTAKALKRQKNAYKGPESDIQEIITQCANDRGVHLIHANDQIWAYVLGLTVDKPPQYFVDWFKETFRYLPDCLAFAHGEAWSAELKKKGGVVSGGQIKKVATLGANVFCNAQDAIDNFNEWLERVSQW